MVRKTFKLKSLKMNSYGEGCKPLKDEYREIIRKNLQIFIVIGISTSNSNIRLFTYWLQLSKMKILILEINILFIFY